MHRRPYNSGLTARASWAHDENSGAAPVGRTTGMMRMRCHIPSIAAVLVMVAAAAPGWAQRAISARAGLLHYIEGRVDIDGQIVEPETYRFTHLQQDQILTTKTRCRVELLLNPYAFLRVAENSSVRLVSADLMDTRIELLSGRAILDVDDIENGNSITVVVQGMEIEIRKDGLYQFAVPDLLRVYDGEAVLAEAKVTKGRQIEISGASLEPAKFDREEHDDLYRWNARRARAIDRTNGPSFPRLRLGWTF